MTRFMVRHSALSRSTSTSSEGSMVCRSGVAPRSVDSVSMTVELLHRCWWPRHRRHDQPNHKPTQRELADEMLPKIFASGTAHVPAQIFGRALCWTDNGVHRIICVSRGAPTY